MSEERAKLAKVYKRAAIGLAIASLLWIAAFLIAGTSGESKLSWLIPIAAAGLSVLCFSLYSKSKEP